ncbi:MAG: EamA family transporter [Betaproteobacteria bacterium]|jgi:O-acetylserine/cysteine efflux transporter
MTPIHLAAALLMVTIWGFNFVVMRWRLNEVPPVTLTLLRFALAAFPALLFVKRPRVEWWRLAAYGFFAFALQFSLLFMGMNAGMPTGLSSLVIQVQAFFTIGLAVLLSRERPRGTQLAGAVLAGAGLVFVAVHLPGGTRLGLLLVVAAAASWATANLIVKHLRGEPLAIVVWASACAVPPLALAALVIDGPARMAGAVASLSAAQWLGVAFQAWPTTLLAFGIWAWLLRLYPATVVAPFTLLVPVVGMSCAVWLLGEPLLWWKLAGAALALAGLALNVFAARFRAGR